MWSWDGLAVRLVDMRVNGRGGMGTGVNCLGGRMGRWMGS